MISSSGPGGAAEVMTGWLDNNKGCDSAASLAANRFEE